MNIPNADLTSKASFFHWERGMASVLRDMPSVAFLCTAGARLVCLGARDHRFGNRPQNDNMGLWP